MICKPHKPCLGDIDLTALCCVEESCCDDPAAPSLADIAIAPGLAAWVAAKGMREDPTVITTYSAVEIEVLARFQSALVEANTLMWHRTGRWVHGPCKMRLHPCVPCPCRCMARSCSACKRSSLTLRFGTLTNCLDPRLIETVEVVRWRATPPAITPTETRQVVSIGSGALSAPWRLQVHPRLLLVAQGIDECINNDYSNDLGEAPGMDGTWWVEVTLTDELDPVYRSAVADLACVIAERCIPASRCGGRLPEVASRSNDGESVSFQRVDAALLAGGFTGITNVDRAIAALSNDIRPMTSTTPIGDFDWLEWLN